MTINTKFMIAVFAAWAILPANACAPRQQPVAIPELTREALHYLSFDTLCQHDRPMPDGASPAYVILRGEDAGCIYYDSEKLSQAWRDHGRSAVLGVMAHELAHVLIPGARNASYDAQLLADETAGCVLARAKAPVGPFIDYLESLLGTESRSFNERAAAVMRGAGRCGTS